MSIKRLADFYPRGVTESVITRYDLNWSNALGWNHPQASANCLEGRISSPSSLWMVIGAQPT
jgi:hypothetical protein